MQSYYEKNREDNQSLEYKRSTNHSYPPHFHLNLEIFLLDRGEYEITVNDNKYTVTDGDIVVFDSYDIHSYERKSVPKAGGNDGLLVIPYRYLTRFNGWRKNFRIATPIIRNERLCAELLALADKYLIGETDERVKESALDLLLARLLESLQFSESKTKDEGMLIRSILAYIQQNYRAEISRKSIARSLGYTEAHISRVFHRYLGVGLAEYINGLRLAYVKKLRANGDTRTTIELIYEAGFNSQQTYYRVKGKSNV